MKALVSEYIESLLADTSGDLRSGRRLLTLIGILGEAKLPENIEAESLRLSKYLTLREIYNSLLEPLNHYAKKGVPSTSPQNGNPVDTNLEKLLAEVKEARTELTAHEAINYPLLTSWVIRTAREKKLITSR